MRIAGAALAALGLLTMSARGAEAAVKTFEQGDPALWRWLPHGESIFAPWNGHRASRSTAVDPLFKIPGGKLVAYDRVHGIVLYWQGCCAWQETMLARVATAPPHFLDRADLSGVRTAHGIALGAAPEAVRRAYGPAVLHRSTTTPTLLELSYYRIVSAPNCGWFENFLFRRGRLVQIQAGNGC